MRAPAGWPPKARDTRAIVEAYQRVLGWPLIVGTTFVSPDRAAAELAERPNVQLSTPCSAFDAVTVSHAVGMETMVLLGRRDVGPVPCLTVHRDQSILLVQAGTGGVFAGLENVSVEAGSGGRLILPPSPSRQWDTPPWDIKAEAPCPPLAGPVLAPCIHDALRLFGVCST